MPQKRDFVTSYLSIVISIISSLLMLPWYISYFGTDKYGAWIIINTFVQYLALSNFGIPTSLTVIASNQKIKSSITPLFWRCLKILFCALFFVTTLVVFFILNGKLTSSLIFGNHVDSANYFTCLLYYLALYVVRAPFLLSLSFFLGEGKVYLSRIYEILTNLTNPLTFLIIVYFNLNIFEFIIISGSILFIIAFISFIHALTLLPKTTTPESFHDIPSVRSIIKVSIGYFATGIGAALVWNTDSIVISHFLPLSDVSKYSVCFRIFTTAFLAYNTYNNILLPHYGIYNSKNDYQSLSDSFHKSVFVSVFLSSIIWVAVFLFGKEIIILWTHSSNLYVGLEIFYVLGAYGFVLSIISSVSTLFSSLKKVKVLVLVTFIEGFVNLVLSILLVRKIGILGVALGTLIGAICSLCILYKYFQKISLKYYLKLPFFTIVKGVFIGLIPIFLVKYTILSDFLMFKVVFFISLTILSFILFKKELLNNKSIWKLIKN